MVDKKVVFAFVISMVLFVSIASVSAFNLIDWIKGIFGKPEITGNPIYDASGSGALARYSFEEDSYSGRFGEVGDSSGVNNGVAKGGTQVENPGIKGKSVKFDGVNDYVETKDFSFRNNANFTFSLWVKTTMFRSNQVIFGKPSPYWEYTFMTYGPNAVRFVYWNTRGMGEIDMYSPSNVLSINNWTHFVITYDGSAKIAKMYINGVLSNTDNTITNTLQNRANNLWIGAGYYGGAQRYFNGNIDEFMIFNKALSKGEVIELYNERFSKVEFKFKSPDEVKIISAPDGNPCVAFKSKNNINADKGGADEKEGDIELIPGYNIGEVAQIMSRAPVVKEKSNFWEVALFAPQGSDLGNFYVDESCLIKIAQVVNIGYFDALDAPTKARALAEAKQLNIKYAEWWANTPQSIIDSGPEELINRFYQEWEKEKQFYIEEFTLRDKYGVLGTDLNELLAYYEIIWAEQELEQPWYDLKLTENQNQVSGAQMSDAQSGDNIGEPIKRYSKCSQVPKGYVYREGSGNKYVRTVVKLSPRINTYCGNKKMDTYFIKDTKATSYEWFATAFVYESEIENAVSICAEVVLVDYHNSYNQIDVCKDNCNKVKGEIQPRYATLIYQSTNDINEKKHCIDPSWTFPEDWDKKYLYVGRITQVLQEMSDRQMGVEGSFDCWHNPTPAIGETIFYNLIPSKDSCIKRTSYIDENGEEIFVPPIEESKDIEAGVIEKVTPMTIIGDGIHGGNCKVHPRCYPCMEGTVGADGYFEYDTPAYEGQSCSVPTAPFLAAEAGIISNCEYICQAPALENGRCVNGVCAPR